MKDQNNISFFKKIWWSISNLNKYDELINFGLKKSIKYFMGLLAILTIVLSLVTVYMQSKNVNDIAAYLNEKLPEFNLEKKDEDYKLNIDTKETVILDDNKFLGFFKNVVVINDSLKEKEATEEYSDLANDEHNCIVFLKDECILITKNQEEVTKYKYADILTKFTGTNNDEYNKISVINYFSNISYTNYMLVYFVSYFIILLVVFALDIIVISVVSIIFTKLLKIKINAKSIFTLTIYALTLSSILYIIYLITSSLTGFYFAYTNIVNILISYIYIGIYFIKKRKNLLQDNK